MKKFYKIIIITFLFFTHFSFSKQNSTSQLFLAAKNGDINLAKKALKNGAAIFAKDIFDKTPLHISAYNGRINIVKLLIKGNYYKGLYVKADANIEDGYGLTPLHYSVMGNTKNHRQIVKLLIKEGADINAQRTERFSVNKKISFPENVSPLHIASKLGNYEIVSLLIGFNDVNINVKDGYGLTPLHYAATSVKTEGIKIVELLINNKVDINARSEKKFQNYLKGSTPLKMAIYFLADKIMHEISNYVKNKTLNYLKPTIVSNRTLYNYIINYYDRKGKLDDGQFLKVFRKEIKKNKEFVMVYYADTIGNLVMAKRMPDSSISNRFVKRDEKEVKLIYKHKNKAYNKTFPNKIDSLSEGYDPRKRIWYKKAVHKKNMIWTDVYTFATDKKPGISNAIPIYHDDKLVAVSSIDVGVVELSYFLNKLKIGKRGKAFLMGYNKAEKKVKAIALPIKNAYEIEQLFKKYKEGKKFKYKVVSIDEIKQKDIVFSFRAFKKNYASIQNLKKHSIQQFSYLYKDESYLSTYIPFPSETGLNWIIGVIIPENEIMRSVEKNISLIRSREKRKQISSLSRLVYLLKKNGGKSLDVNDDLFLALKIGDLKKVRSAITNGANINTIDKHGWYPLHYAAYFSGSSGERILLDLLRHPSIEVNVKTKSEYLEVSNNKTAFDIVKKFKNNKLIHIFLANQKEANANLFKAIKKNQIKDLLRALKQGAKIDASDANGRTALHMAIIEGNDEVAKELIKNGASLSKMDFYGWSALHFAAKFERYDIAELLIKKGVNVNIKTRKKYLNLAGYITPLKIVENYFESPLESLFKKHGGISYDANDLFILAIYKCDKYKIIDAIKKGADVNTRDKRGWTALHELVYKMKDFELVKYMVENGADVNARTNNKYKNIKEGSSILTILKRRRNRAKAKEWAKFLKKNGARELR